MPGAYFSTGIGAMHGKMVSGKTNIPTAGTAVQVTATSTPIAGVFVGGDSNNADIVLVGDSNVNSVAGSQQGISLEPAGNSLFIPINNLNLLYVDAVSNGDDVIWVYFQPETIV